MSEQHTKEDAFPKRGRFSLSKDKLKYPTPDDKVMISRIGFNSVQLKGTMNNAVLLVTHNGTLISKHFVHPLIGTDKIYDTVPFPFKDNSGTLQFEVEQVDKSNPDFSAEIEFELMNIPAGMYDALSGKYSMKMK